MITYKIIEATRERIISEDCEKLKVTAEFSDGEIRSYHFPLDTTKELIIKILDKTCKNTLYEATLQEESKERQAAEQTADETAKSLLT